jgi:preprotein translocase subunit YajC
MISKVRRGDTVVTTGGLIGKVSKVVAEGDDELQVEIAEGTRVRIARSMVSEVRAKGEPVKEDS